LVPIYPLYSLEAAAGKFGKQQLTIEPEGWVQVPASRNIRLTQDMFVIHIKGFSMEPDILVCRI
jgi:phage repressor protein C with HTH and peptisase S24 domain